MASGIFQQLEELTDRVKEVEKQMNRFKKETFPQIQAEVHAVLGPAADAAGKVVNSRVTLIGCNNSIVRLRQRLDQLEECKGAPRANKLLNQILVERGERTDWTNAAAVQAARPTRQTREGLDVEYSKLLEAKR